MLPIRARIPAAAFSPFPLLHPQPSRDNAAKGIFHIMKSTYPQGYPHTYPHPYAQVIHRVIHRISPDLSTSGPAPGKTPRSASKLKGGESELPSIQTPVNYSGNGEIPACQTPGGIPDMRKKAGGLYPGLPSPHNLSLILAVF